MYIKWLAITKGGEENNQSNVLKQSLIRVLLYLIMSSSETAKKATLLLSPKEALLDKEKKGKKGD